MELKEFKELKVGDKVKIYDVPCSVWWGEGMNKYRGKTMTIREVDFDTVPAVRMVEDNGEGTCGYGWWWTPSMIEKKVEGREETVIVIKTDGKTVTAYRGKEKGVAVCSPEDEFDLYTGASLALDRLFGEDKKHHSYSFPMKGTFNVEFDDDKLSGSIKFNAPVIEGSMEEKKIDIPAEALMEKHEAPKQFKPGDKVRVVSKRPKNSAWNPKRDKWLGKVMTIRDLYSDRVYHMEEDREEWHGCCGEGFLWHKDWIEEKVDNKLYGLGDYTLLKSVGDSAKSAKDAIDGLTYACCVIDELQTKPEVKEVKREAKVGEWIKIVKPICTGGFYSKGDILKVTSEGLGCAITKFKDYHAYDERLINITKRCFPIMSCEYVVLENYEPEEK